MDLFTEIFNNKVITVPVFAWLVAQITKVIYDLEKYKKIDIRRLVGSGGMPSSHAAFVTSLATTVGVHSGWGTPPFGIAFAFAMVVMYDASGVRRAAGKQAQVLNRIIQESQESGRLANLDVNLKELIGHTPIEVLVGAIMGILFGFIFS
jgi:hypothetical protein